MNKRIEKKCLNCGKIFTIPQCRDWREHCCPGACKKEFREKSVAESAQKRVRTCLLCGKEFVARQWQIDTGIGKYCSLHCSHKSHKGKSVTEETRNKMSIGIKNSAKFIRSIKRGKDNPSFKPTRLGGGYRFITIGINKKVQEHRFVAEKILGRKLLRSEIIHHIDGNKLNNYPENLLIVSRSEHAKIHAGERKQRKKYFETLKKLWETQGIFVVKGRFILQSSCSNFGKAFGVVRK